MDEGMSAHCPICPLLDKGTRPHELTVCVYTANSCITLHVSSWWWR